MSRVVNVFAKNVKDINDRRSQEPGTIILDGVLHKQGAVNTNWKRRYFCLRKNEYSLSYYAMEGDVNPRGVIPLQGMEIKRCSKKTRLENPFTFKLYNPKTVKYSRIKSKFISGHRSYYMYANTEVEESKWIDAIQLEISKANSTSHDTEHVDQCLPSFSAMLLQTTKERLRN